MYLESLEASFVNDLYHTMHFGGLCSRKSFWGTYSSQELPQETNNSGQVGRSMLCISSVCTFCMSGLSVLSIFLLHLLLTLFCNVQCMVLQDGTWQNINYEREETILETAADCHGTTGSPCMHPFTSSGKRHYVASPDLQESKSYNEGIHLRGKRIDFSVTTRSSKHKCQEDSVGGITGFSD